MKICLSIAQCPFRTLEDIPGVYMELEDQMYTVAYYFPFPLRIYRLQNALHNHRHGRSNHNESFRNKTSSPAQVACRGYG